MCYVWVNMVRAVLDLDVCRLPSASRLARKSTCCRGMLKVQSTLPGGRCRWNRGSAWWRVPFGARGMRRRLGLRPPDQVSEAIVTSVSGVDVAEILVR